MHLFRDIKKGALKRPSGKTNLFSELCTLCGVGLVTYEWPIYSDLRAASGSTRVARRAGM